MSIQREVASRVPPRRSDHAGFLGFSEVSPAGARGPAYRWSDVTEAGPEYRSDEGTRVDLARPGVTGTGVARSRHHALHRDDVGAARDAGGHGRRPGAANGCR